ncbi:alpha/beta hydrolase [Niveispirillum sp. KHB5.9]|uniref:alpha/beta hydrolase n=1 Tax=Niveispirillum sp. KHB5.9 TaxID=3400269 RepID=UPI003A83D018
MRQFILPALTALPLVLGAVTANAAPCEERTFFQPPLEYTSVEVLADGRVIFRLCAKDARDVVALPQEMKTVPTGMDGKPPGLPMTKDGEGYWVATTAGAVDPGVYTYNFKVDGLRIADPRGTRFAEAFGGVQSIFQLPGAATANQFYKADVPHGLVSVVEYPSTSLGGITRRAHVYTPPGYEAGGKETYPVLYLVHGYSDSDDAWTMKGNANYILDNLIAAGKAKPMIIVMPQGHTPAREGVQGMENTDFGNDLHKDLIPYIDKHFRTKAAVKTRAMVGLSMGGAHTIMFGLPRPDVFGSIGVFSIGMMSEEQTAKYRKVNEAALKARAKAGGLVFYAIGKEDFVITMAPPFRKILEDHGIKYTNVETGGGHTWINWRAYLEQIAPLLFN